MMSFQTHQQHQHQQILVEAAADAAASAPIQVNDDNVEEILTGPKATFMMFYGSQCLDCEDMTPEWNRLANEWEGHAFGQIAQVDCETEGTEQICDYFQIQQIPTLVFGGSMEWDFYHGSHDFESLSEFAKKAISKPICSVRFLEHCDKTELAVIQSFSHKSTEQLQEIHQQAQAKMRVRHEEFQEKEAQLLEQQHVLMKEFNTILQEASGEYDFKLLMQMMEQRAQQAQQQQQQQRNHQQQQQDSEKPKKASFWGSK